MGGVVSPGLVTRELGDRHELHDIDPEVNQVIQPLGRAIQVARLPIGVACEGSDGSS